MIPVKNIRAKNPALFIRWSKGVVLNTETGRTEEIKWIDFGIKKIPYVNEKIING